MKASNYQKRSIISVYRLFVVTVIILLVSAFFTQIDEFPSHFSLPYHFLNYPFYHYIVGHTPISSIIAFFFLILTGVSLYYVNNSFFLVSSESKMLLTIYLLLSAINPSIIYFSKYHVIALLILWALYYNIKYIVYEKENLRSLFISIFLLSISTTLAPELIYLCIVIFFKGLFFKTRNFCSYLLTSIAAFILPFIYILSFRYIFLDDNSITYLTSFFHSAIAINHSFIPFSNNLLHSLLFSSVVLLVFLSGLLSQFGRRNYDSFSIKSKAFKRCIVFSTIILVIDLLFAKNDLAPIELVLFIPFSLILLDFMERAKNKKGVNLYVATLVILIIAYRLSYFFPLINIR